MSETSSEQLSLFTPGCLGTCWYGKYHYFEPWVGCEHDCDYCYARYRSVVTNKLDELGTDFAHPVPLMPADSLIKAIVERLATGDINIIKSSRYTDLFTPKYVENGLTAQILQTLADSPAKRVIITTKGLPDENCLKIMASVPAKFSYNPVFKPETPVPLERHIFPLRDRLNAALELQERGIKVTVHMDPVIPGYEDDEDALRTLFTQLREAGLRRVMFSTLLLTEQMIRDIERRIGAEHTKRILECFDIEASRRILPKQEETQYIELKPKAKQRLVDLYSELLREFGFEFVVCGLKSVSKGLNIDRSKCPVCDGTFYA